MEEIALANTRQAGNDQSDSREQHGEVKFNTHGSKDQLDRSSVHLVPRGLVGCHLTSKITGSLRSATTKPVRGNLPCYGCVLSIQQSGLLCWWATAMIKM
jgi:hypothetical protein